MEYYSAMKKKEILRFAAIWMDIEDIMLSEKSQTQKDPCGVIPLPQGIENKLTEAESRVMVARAG